MKSAAMPRYSQLTNKNHLLLSSAVIKVDRTKLSLELIEKRSIRADSHLLNQILKSSKKILRNRWCANQSPGKTRFSALFCSSKLHRLDA